MKTPEGKTKKFDSVHLNRNIFLYDVVLLATLVLTFLIVAWTFFANEPDYSMPTFTEGDKNWEHLAPSTKIFLRKWSGAFDYNHVLLSDLTYPS